MSTEYTSKQIAAYNTAVYDMRKCGHMRWQHAKPNGFERNAVAIENGRCCRQTCKCQAFESARAVE